MIFDAFPTDDCLGLVLAHSLRLPDRVLKKGRVLDAEDVAALRAAGHRRVIGARLEDDDVGEDEAAAAVAVALAGEGTRLSPAATGRCNLVATCHGLVLAGREALDRLNLLDEAVTVATAAPGEVVLPGQVVATIKIIPFAVPRAVVDSCAAVASAGPPLGVAPFRPHRAGLILTRLPGLKEGILDRTAKVTAERLHALGSGLEWQRRCLHEPDAVAEAAQAALAAGCDLLLISGASATVDRRDVVPAGISSAGGEIVHFGLPVDPGNLLLLARIDAVPVIDMPGCGRSPKLNGLDWVLRRVVAGQPVARREIAAMGVGGLLKEVPRPLPRERAVGGDAGAAAPQVAAVVLAAGRASRMGRNKLLLTVDGVPMVVRAVEAALASQARPVIVVTGHEAEAVRDALAGRPVTFVHNPDFGEGMSTSVRRGLEALPEAADGALMCLGDMPGIRAGHLDRLIAAFAPQEGCAICVPTHDGKRGNPVLLGRAFFPALGTVSGDRGARGLLAEHHDQVCEVELDEAVVTDVDTPESYAEVSKP